MASTTQDELYKTFAAVAGKPSSNLDGIANSLADVVFQIGGIQTNQTAAIQAQAPQTQAPQTQTSAPAAAGNSTLGTVESIASTFLKSGFGMVPMVSELLGLFGGGGSPAPAPLVKYAMPAAINFEAADSGSGLSNADSDQWGMPRAYGAGAAGGSAPASSPATVAPGSTATPNNDGGKSIGGSGAPSASPQITVNVQAMDARSFLDRSNDIAAAVRDAMLNLNSINDVVNDL
jgi:cell pole-organizing protein PopZ